MCAILNHFLKRPGPNRLVQKAMKMVTSPSHWLTQHTFIALCSSSNLECISWHIRPTCLAKTCRYQHSLSLHPPLSVSFSLLHTHTYEHARARACAHTRARARTHTHTHTHTHTVCVYTVIIKLSVILSLLSRLDVCQNVDNYLSGEPN